MKLILSDTPLHIDTKTNSEVQYIDLSALQINHCIGCFGCWTKTPGRCVIRDDAPQVYPYIAKSDTLLYVSHIKYGGYDIVMKTMLERAIPIQQAFLRILDGETHHVQRAVVPKTATIVAYGNLSEEEKALFRQLVARNARNMQFQNHSIVFTTESHLQQTIQEVMESWSQS